MKVIALTYTCEKDRERAEFHSQFLPKEWRKIWCVESKDAKIAAPEGVEILVRDFPRGGTLKTAPALEGMRGVFLELARESDLVVKIDSDTALFRPRAFTAPAEYADVDFTYVRRLSIESRLLCNGCCYAVSKRALHRLAKNFSPSDFPKTFGGAEDLVFSSFWSIKNKDLTLCQIDKTKWSWAAKPYLAADCFGAHNGYLTQEADFDICRKIARARSNATAAQAFQQQL